MNKLRDIVLFKPLLYDSGKKLSTASLLGLPRISGHVAIRATAPKQRTY